MNVEFVFLQDIVSFPLDKLKKNLVIGGVALPILLSRSSRRRDGGIGAIHLIEHMPNSPYERQSGDPVDTPTLQVLFFLKELQRRPTIR
jgi:hypothetical protein